MGLSQLTVLGSVLTLDRAERACEGAVSPPLPFFDFSSREVGGPGVAGGLGWGGFATGMGAGEVRSMVGDVRVERGVSMVEEMSISGGTPVPV